MQADRSRNRDRRFRPWTMPFRPGQEILHKNRYIDKKRQNFALASLALRLHILTKSEHQSERPAELSDESKNLPTKVGIPTPKDTSDVGGRFAEFSCGFFSCDTVYNNTQKPLQAVSETVCAAML